jgi:Tol biopolymer transport system component
VLVDSSDEGPYFMAVHGSTPSAPSVSVWFWRNDTVDTEGEAVELSVNAGDTVPQFAPDARHVAYVSRASGRPEIWVQSFPDGRLRRQISFRGGTAPVWAPDGTELFFNERDTLMRVAVSTAGELVASPPEPLFAHLRLTGTPAPYARYAVSPDGQRFLTVEADGEATAPVVRLVQGWLSEFGRRD